MSIPSRHDLLKRRGIPVVKIRDSTGGFSKSGGFEVSELPRLDQPRLGLTATRPVVSAASQPMRPAGLAVVSFGHCLGYCRAIRADYLTKEDAQPAFLTG